MRNWFATARKLGGKSTRIMKDSTGRHTRKRSSETGSTNSSAIRSAAPRNGRPRSDPRRRWWVLQKIFCCCCYACPARQAEQPPTDRTAYRRRIGQSCRVLTVRRCLLGRIAVCDLFTSILPAIQTVVSERNQPIGQHRERVFASTTDTAPNPDAFMCAIVRLSRPWPMIVASWQTGHRRGRHSNGITPDPPCLSLLRVR
jgi:hypothetical protein